MLGSYVACRPIGKKIALVQCAASAASTAGVFFGHGPSSKVSTTSPSRKKSWLLKCSKPKPGPPVVSISTTRETPMASGLLHEVGMAAAIALSAPLSATVVTEPGARPSVGVACACAGAAVGAGAGMEAFWKKIAPNTATHSTIASADAIAARRMSDLQTLKERTPDTPSAEFRPISLNPTLSGQFEAESTNSAIIWAQVSPGHGGPASWAGRLAVSSPQRPRGRPPVPAYWRQRRPAR